MRRRSHRLLTGTLYWLLGAPTTFLAVLYAGSLTLAFSPSDTRPPIGNLLAAPYTMLVLVAAWNLTWAFWRVLRGDSAASAFRPFPWPVWVFASLVGLTSGTIGWFLHARHS